MNEEKLTEENSQDEWVFCRWGMIPLKIYLEKKAELKGTNNE